MGNGGILNKVQEGDLGWMAAASPSLTIAQPFMAGFTVWECSQSRQGRKEIVCRP